MRYAVRMGTGMSLSGLFNVGHDVGGFSGDKPEPELFVRWVQNGVMHPRFTIHSWNDDQTMKHGCIRPSLRRSAQPLSCATACCPYLYTLLWQAHVMMSRCCADLPRSPARCADLANAMTSCWALRPAGGQRGRAGPPASSALLDDRPVGTISTAISGSPAAVGDAGRAAGEEKTAAVGPRQRWSAAW
ncbi:hypothetical protein MJ561_10030 [Klebsiella pneumoniae]|nr:hypothetical protein MJ561_10030 [Klebsiella pneumoniae]